MLITAKERGVSLGATLVATGLRKRTIERRGALAERDATLEGEDIVRDRLN
jgi:hypothetical protein